VPDVAVNPRWEAMSRTNVILRSGRSGDYHVDAYTTPLTVKTVVRGVAHYHTPRTRYRIEPGAAVVLNAGQTYGMDLDGDDRTQTLCVFFRPGFVEAAAADDLFEPAAYGFEMSERLFAIGDGFAARLAALDHGLGSGRAGDDAWLADHVLGIARELAVSDGRARREMSDFPGLRHTTRQEAFRRLHWARDFIDATFRDDTSIGELAKVACMSPFHFHRLFKRAFGETPMQRVQRLRLDEAARLLESSELDVTRICFDVGFTSLGSFSALYRRRFGESPRGFRQKRRIGEVPSRRAR
jgi:AraC-like DNA-binding protein